jgi:hypothetical protein
LAQIRLGEIHRRDSTAEGNQDEGFHGSTRDKLTIGHHPHLQLLARGQSLQPGDDCAGELTTESGQGCSPDDAASPD